MSKLYTIKKFFKNGAIKTSNIWTNKKGIVNKWKEQELLNQSVWCVNIIEKLKTN